MYSYFNRRVFITASLGNTHDGNVRMAKKLIVVSKRAKADAVKFQKRDPELHEDTEIWTKDKEFGKEEYDEIQALCSELGILWYVSLYDTNSLEFMEKNYDLKCYKIPSCKITDLNLIREVAKSGKLSFISTGMATIKEVDDAITAFYSYNRNLIIMHCCSIYPSAPGDVNLRVMRTLHKHYELHTGYDSHDTGFAVSEAAVGMGAKAIEKHVTLDRAIEGSQHSTAMEPRDFERLVSDIRDIERSFGSAHKKLLDREIPFRSKATGESPDDLLKLERRA